MSGRLLFQERRVSGTRARSLSGTVGELAALACFLARDLRADAARRTRGRLARAARFLTPRQEMRAARHARARAPHPPDRQPIPRGLGCPQIPSRIMKHPLQKCLCGDAVSQLVGSVLRPSARETVHGLSVKQTLCGSYEHLDDGGPQLVGVNLLVRARFVQLARLHRIHGGVGEALARKKRTGGEMLEQVICAATEARLCPGRQRVEERFALGAYSGMNVRSCGRSDCANACCGNVGACRGRINHGCGRLFRIHGVECLEWGANDGRCGAVGSRRWRCASRARRGRRLRWGSRRRLHHLHLRRRLHHLRLRHRSVLRLASHVFGRQHLQQRRGGHNRLDGRGLATCESSA